MEGELLHTRLFTMTRIDSTTLGPQPREKAVGKEVQRELSVLSSDSTDTRWATNT